MGGALHPGVARAGASFELERLEIVDGRLVVRGWWFGVRGVRFVRPGLVVDGRRVLATLEHKPWAAGEDGAWTAAFPWKGGLDVAGVTLVVAPSVEVPLDRDSDPPPPALREVGIEEARAPLRDELASIERELDTMQAELRGAVAHAAEREERCRELEDVVARERRAASDAGVADDEIVRAHAMAVLDRDRAVAQHAEAVNDREAAVRARKRMERQRDEALAARLEADARRDAALAERDEVRRQRDELLLAHQALQAQLKGSLADADRTEPLPSVRPTRGSASVDSGPAPHEATEQLRSPRELAGARRARRAERAGAGRLRPSPPDGAAAAETVAAEPGSARPLLPSPPDGAAAAPDTARGEARSTPDAIAEDLDAPIGVRTIPAARSIAASLHRSQRERGAGVTRYDMWAIRILGSVAALAFISLLVMILKAFFVF